MRITFKWRVSLCGRCTCARGASGAVQHVAERLRHERAVGALQDGLGAAVEASLREDSLSNLLARVRRDPAKQKRAGGIWGESVCDMWGRIGV